MSIMIARLTLTSVPTWRKNYIKNTWKSAQQHKKRRHLALWRYEYEGAGDHLQQKGRPTRVAASVLRCFSDGLAAQSCHWWLTGRNNRSILLSDQLTIIKNVSVTWLKWLMESEAQSIKEGNRKAQWRTAAFYMFHLHVLLSKMRV